MVKITPVSKTNSLYYDKHTSFKCVIFFYKIINIVFGLNFGFIKFKCFKYNISLICAIIQCTFYMILAGNSISHSTTPQPTKIWYIYLLVRYLTGVLLLSFIKEELTFCNLFHDLRTIDLGLKANHASYNLEVKLLLLIFTHMCFRLTVSSLYCFYFELLLCISKWNGFIHFFVFYSLDVLLITCGFMFYAINCRLKKLAALVMAESSNFLSKQYLYKSIVDIAEQHKTGIGLVVSYFNI